MSQSLPGDITLPTPSATCRFVSTVEAHLVRELGG